MYLESCGAGFVLGPVPPSRGTESANHWVASTPTHSLLIIPSFLVISFHRPGIGLSSGAPNPDLDSLQISVSTLADEPVKIKQQFRDCLTGSINSGLRKVREINHRVQLICG